MKDTINILIVMESIGVGGTERFAMNLYRHIDRSRYHMDFAVFDASKTDYLDEVTAAGSAVYTCPPQPGGVRGMLGRTAFVKKILREHRYDIVHSNACSFFGILEGTLPAKMRRGVKSIAHAHGIGDPGGGRLEGIARAGLKALLSATADVGLTCSDTAGESKYTRRFMASERYQIVNNAVDTAAFAYDEGARREVRGEFGIPEDAFVPGIVARLGAEKNHVFLIDAFAEVVKKRPNSRLLIVGDGETRASIEAAAQNRGVADRVILAGNRPDAWRFYSAMDCFALPSLYEGFPFVLVEAQINGLRCVVSNNMSRSVNITGEVRFLTLAQRPEEWADALIAAGDGRIAPEKTARAAEQFDIHTLAKDMQALYDRLAQD